jgi:hypothetical protein
MSGTWKVCRAGWSGPLSQSSTRSFAFASSMVCHCMLLWSSGPLRFRGITWSTTYPGHAPAVLPVDGHGFARRNARRCAGLRLIRPLASRVQVAHLAREEARAALYKSDLLARRALGVRLVVDRHTVMHGYVRRIDCNRGTIPDQGGNVSNHEVTRWSLLADATGAAALVTQAGAGQSSADLGASQVIR